MNPDLNPYPNPHRYPNPNPNTPQLDVSFDGHLALKLAVKDNRADVIALLIADPRNSLTVQDAKVPFLPFLREP